MQQAAPFVVRRLKARGFRVVMATITSAIHPNRAGYQAMGEAIDVKGFGIK